MLQKQQRWAPSVLGFSGLTLAPLSSLPYRIPGGCSKVVLQGLSGWKQRLDRGALFEEEDEV